MIGSILFTTLVTLAALSDIKSRKVPNKINFTLLLSGVSSSIVGEALPAGIPLSVGYSLGGALVALLVLLYPFALNVYQGGDVKLCIGMGAWLGIEGVLWTIALGVIGGGVLGSLILAQKYFRSRFINDIGASERAQDSVESTTIPMAVSFAAFGVIVYSLGAPPKLYG